MSQLTSRTETAPEKERETARHGEMYRASSIRRPTIRILNALTLSASVAVSRAPTSPVPRPPMRILKSVNGLAAGFNPRAATPVSAVRHARRWIPAFQDSHRGAGGSAGQCRAAPVPLAPPSKILIAGARCGHPRAPSSEIPKRGCEGRRTRAAANCKNLQRLYTCAVAVGGGRLGRLREPAGR